MASVVAFNPADKATIVSCLEGSGSQSFEEGDLVKFSSGTVVIATAGAIDGIALKDASGTASTVIPVELIDYNKLYVATYKSSATAQTLVGSLVDFTFTAGAHTLDEDGASTDAVCYGFYDAVGTTSGKLLIKFYHSSGLQA